jgi:hypothetical protein
MFLTVLICTMLLTFAFRYDIEYKVESSRGLNHYSSRSTIANKKLYVFTAQCKEDSFLEVGENIRQILDSLVVGI